MKLVISCAEASSDIHGAALVRALKSELKNNYEDLELTGMGGVALKREGLIPIIEADQMLAMGFTEIISRLPRIFKALKKLEAHCLAVRPDYLIVVDYPDFHIRLAKRLKASGINVVYYIPPKVWIWRKRRVKLLAFLFKKIIVIFPFEKTFFSRNQLEVSYFGNPLLDELPLEMTQEQAQKNLGISNEKNIIGILPGSRPFELKRHLEFLAKFCASCSDQNWIFAICLPEMADLKGFQLNFLNFIKKNISEGSQHPSLRFYQGKSAEVLLASHLAIVKSGTATLEAALLGTPQIIFYKPNPLSCFIIRQIVRYKGPVGLPNLVLEAKGPEFYLAPELLCSQATVERLKGEVIKIGMNYRTDPSFKAATMNLRQKMRTGDQFGPSTLIAQDLIRTYRTKE